jgi:hypothetical protein
MEVGNECDIAGISGYDQSLSDGPLFNMGVMSDAAGTVFSTPHMENSLHSVFHEHL